MDVPIESEKIFKNLYIPAVRDDLRIEAGLEVGLIDEDRVSATHTCEFEGRYLQRGRTGIPSVLVFLTNTVLHQTQSVG